MTKRDLLKSLLLLALILTGCTFAWRQPLPTTDIIYQAGEVTQRTLGAVNSDGSDLEMIRLGDFLRKPVWASDGSLIYGLANGAGVDGYTIGYPAFWDRFGNFKKCSNWSNVEYIAGAGNIDNPKEAIISSGSNDVIIIDLEKCVEIEKLVNHLEWVSFQDQAIMSISYSRDTQELLLSVVRSDGTQTEYRILKLNLTTKEEIMLAEGIHPSWSPDGSKIVYVQTDGIYVMNSDGSQPRILVEHRFADLNSINPFSLLSPLPRWSPDGKWIIYHRCDDYSCLADENTIYKVSNDTGIEESIVSKGAYPSWRP